MEEKFIELFYDSIEKNKDELKKEYAAHVGEVFLQVHVGINAFDTIGDFFNMKIVVPPADLIFTIEQEFVRSLKKGMRSSLLKIGIRNFKPGTKIQGYEVVLQILNEVCQLHFEELKKESFKEFILLGMEHEKNKDKWMKKRIKRTLC